MAKEKLYSAERLIVTAFPHGQVVVLPSDAAGCTVRADLLARLLTGAFELTPGARPAMKVIGARITGKLDLEAANIIAPIWLEQCLFEEAPNLVDADARSIRLPGCQTPGFRAAGVRIRGNLELNAGFVCVGEVNLAGAQISELVWLADALLYNPQGKALDAARLHVGGAFLATRLVASGQFQMISSRIDGLLSLKAARISNPDDISWNAQRIEVGESVFFQRGFKSERRVVLQNARIGGGIDGLAASFINQAGMTCLSLQGAQVAGSANFVEARFRGNVNMTDSIVGRNLTFSRAEFGGEGQQLLNLERLTATRIRLRVSTPPHAIDLSQAHTESIEDDRATWPQKLRLAGCSYQAIYPVDETSVRDRVKWLEREIEGYRPQPYQQLIAAYRRAGEEQHAKRVALENQRRRRATLAWPGRIVGYALDATVGYGYRTWLAGLWLLLFLAAGTAVFTVWPAHAIKPGNIPPFQPFVYTLDLLLPVVNLGQEAAWRAGGVGQWLSWTLILLGWGLTTAVVAGLTRLFNRST